MKRMFILLAAASQLAVSGAAMAQEATAEAQTGDVSAESQSNGEIIVTARRREERLVDVPVSITALSGDTLREQQIFEAADISQVVPSLNVTLAGANRSSVAYSIRGQRTQETQILTDPPVGLYFAEVNQPRTFGLAASFFDLGGIQVFKGVQGTLFGRNMTGGAVLVEPAHPSDEFEGRIIAGIGNYEQRTLEAMLNLPLGDIGALRVAGRINRRDGFIIDQTNGRDYNNDHTDAFRVSLRLNPFEGVENLTIFDYIKVDENGSGLNGDFYRLGGATGAYSLINAAYAGAFGGTPNTPGNVIPNNPAFGAFAGRAVFRPVTDLGATVAAQTAIRDSSNPYRVIGYGIGQGGPFDLNPVGGGVLPYERGENYGITNKTTFELGENLTLKNIFGYRNIFVDILNDLDGTPAPLITAQQTKDIEVISEELQLSGKLLDDKLDFVVGLYYFQEKGSDTNVSLQFPELRIAFDPRPAAFTSNNLLAGGQGSGEATSYAGYGGVTYKLTEKLRLSAGLRYTIDERNIVNRVVQGDGPPSAANPTAVNGFLNACQFNTTPIAGFPNPPLAPAPDCRVRASESWNAVTYDATIGYLPNPDTNIYASFRKGFRAGAYSLRATNYAALAPADPETVFEYELGAKNSTTIGTARLTTSAALFHQDYRDVQRQVPVATPAGVATSILNVAKLGITGGEFEAALSVGRFDLGVGYSYVDIEVKEIAPAIANQLADSGVPKHQLNGNVSWRLPVDETLGDITIGANVSYKSDIRFGTDTNSLPGPNYIGSTQDAYTLVNLTLQWNNVAGSDFSLGAYVKNLTDEFYVNGVIDIVGSTGIGVSSYGAPRTYGMTLGYEF